MLLGPDPSRCDDNVWELLMGTYVGVLGRLEEQRAIPREGCRAKRSWGGNRLEDALRMSFDAIADEEMIASIAVEGTTAWSPDALMKIEQKFGSKQARREVSPWLTCARHVTLCRKTILCGSWQKQWSQGHWA